MRYGGARPPPRAAVGPTGHELKNNPISLQRYMRRFVMSQRGNDNRSKAASYLDDLEDETKARQKDQEQEVESKITGAKALEILTGSLNPANSTTASPAVDEELVDTAMEEMHRRLQKHVVQPSLTAKQRRKEQRAEHLHLQLSGDSFAQERSHGGADAADHDQGDISEPAKSPKASQSPKRRVYVGSGSVGTALPSASSPDFRQSLANALEECRKDPSRRKQLQRYVHRNFQFSHYAKPLSKNTAPSGRPQSARQPFTKDSASLGMFLTQYPESEVAWSAARTQRSPSRPLSARSAIDEKVESVRRRKWHLDEQFQQHCDEVERKWQQKVERNQEDPLEPGGPCWLADRWGAIVYALVVIPREMVTYRKGRTRQLRQTSSADLVLQFAGKMKAVVQRRRRRRRSAAWALLRATVAWIGLLKMVSTRRRYVRMIHTSLVQMARRKPTMFFVRRFYSKVLKCQQYIRNRIAAVKARKVWFLASFNLYEMKMKGSRCSSHAEPPYPNANVIAGRSLEEISKLCADVGSMATTLPLTFKLSLFNSYFRHEHKKHVKAMASYAKQLAAIRKLCLRGMLYPEAQAAIWTRDGRLRRPHWSVAPSETAIKQAYATGMKRYKAYLHEKFMFRRANHAFYAVARFISEVFHNGIVYDSKVSVDEERALVTAIAPWCYEVVSTAASVTPTPASSPSKSRGAKSSNKPEESRTTTLHRLVRLYTASFPPLILRTATPQAVAMNSASTPPLRKIVDPTAKKSDV